MKKQDIKSLISEITERLNRIEEIAEGNYQKDLLEGALNAESPRLQKHDEDHPFRPDGYEFIDLGLKSGRRWATSPAPGHYQYDEAVEVFGNYLPRASAMVELWESCKWDWDDTCKGYKVTGPNGNSIFIPANGWQDFDSTGKLIPGALSNVGSYGYWWAFAPYSQTVARYLFFGSGYVSPLYSYYRAFGCGVWPCRELS